MLLSRWDITWLVSCRLLELSVFKPVMKTYDLHLPTKNHKKRPNVDKYTIDMGFYGIVSYQFSWVHLGATPRVKKRGLYSC